ncbi:ABC transporter permease [Echinicola shivajiensis]|uniref:ABC transporter permease n=1 Tax=Echinicola shivajiensis TaxID=1035916 RepID=UPI001BFC9A2E|nr:ABC transporter permease [Echinicola shivajiensis]
MLKHYLTLVIRNFRRHSTTFLINLIGLSFGLASVILIYLWIQDERTVDHYSGKSDQLYQIMTNHDNEGGIMTVSAGPGLLADAMEEEMPEVVKAAATSSYVEDVSFSFENNKIGAEGLFAEQDFFDLFTIPLLYGNSNEVITGINNVAISESTAKKIFGNPEEALGKSMEWKIFNFSDQVMITGIYKDFPTNASMQPDFLLSFDYFRKMLGDGIHWDNHNTLNYVLLKEGTDVNAFNQKIKDFVKSKLSYSKVSLFAQKYEVRYLHGVYENGVVAGGRISYIYIFTIIGILVLLVACINFINLTTARALSRSKEVGIKKAIGAERKQLAYQFMVEIFSLTLLGLFVALVLVFLLLPAFNQITDKELSFGFTVQQWMIFLGMGLLTALISGVYPAVYLSGFQPTTVLKGIQKGSFGELLARKGLVIIQFSVSLVMIIATIVVSKQLSYMQGHNLGYQKDNILMVTPYSLSDQKLNTFLDQAKRIEGVEQASSIFHNLVGSWSTTVGLEWPGKNPDTDIKFENITVNYDLIETLKIPVLDGRSFSKEFGTEDTKIILNEAAVKVIGFDEPVGQTVNLWGNDMEVIGVVQDFNFESLKENIKPAFLKFGNETAQNILVRIKGENIKSTLEDLGKLYHSLNDGDAFEYKFLDETFQTQYEAEQKVETLVRYFGGLAILISCLGLFGLAVFSAERRRKEIGVRKVLGASIGTIVKLMTGEFSLLILWAILVACPLAWWASDRWLAEFAYKTSLEWWVFASGGLILMLIAMLTVGTQAFRAANVNPVNSLRDE